LLEIRESGHHALTRCCDTCCAALRSPIPVLLGVATLVFALIHLVPGDPAQAMLGESAADSDVRDLRTRLGSIGR
jgi:ABC-type dipeptide/oligopeptide/nickel transport system permease component